ncbi:MAG: site-2 protease family protein [Bacteriovoracaceae bacterium]|jgi:Zn-dependent protease|nr:site-2 protease family protein [Bacteriovoracaceae bacterium]
MESFVYKLAIGLPGFLLAIVAHEAAHAYVAKRFGDDTAEKAGRLNLNPIVHFDLIGTVILPLIGAAFGGVMFGWAKPVPINPTRFKNVKYGIFWVSFAGPLANLLLTIVSALIFSFMYTQVEANFFFYKPFTEMLRQSILINIILATFNLIPFPPLDGSKMVSAMLDYEAAQKYEDLQRFSLLFIIIIWTTPIISYIIAPAILAGNGIVNLLITMMS